MSQPDEAQIQRAAQRLRQGGLVAFPTETVYGLGALATDAQAVASVFTCKGRPSDNPLIVHISARREVAQVARHVPAAAQALMDAFWPGPLTLVLPRQPHIPDGVTAGLDTVALRMPDHPVALRLIAAAGPLVAPSANRSGGPSPTTAQHVRDDLGAAVMVLDGGPCRIGLESTVVDVSQGELRVLRPGHLTAAELAQVAGLPLAAGAARAHPSQSAPASPGMKYRHYAPQATVDWLRGSAAPAQLPPDTMALVVTDIDVRGANVVRLKDTRELAQQLYGRFREADELGLRRVLVEEPPQGEPLAEALRNRIQKAITRR